MSPRKSEEDSMIKCLNPRKGRSSQIGVLKTFANFAEKSELESLFNKVAGFNTGVFLWNFASL